MHPPSPQTLKMSGQFGQSKLPGSTIFEFCSQQHRSAKSSSSEPSLFGDSRAETTKRACEEYPRDRLCRLIPSRLVAIHQKAEQHKSRRRALPQLLLLHLRPRDHITTTPSSALRRQTVLEARPLQVTMYVAPPMGETFLTRHLRVMITVVTVMMETQWVRQPGRFLLPL